MKRTYNIAFSGPVPAMGGGIAEVNIEPTTLMMTLEKDAESLEEYAKSLQSRANNARSAAYEIGYKLAKQQYFAQNPDYV